MLIDQAAIKGEVGTGYEPPAGKGPFQCNNCEHFRSGNACDQKQMVKFSRLPRNKEGLPIVDPEGCCEFVERKGNVFAR